MSTLPWSIRHPVAGSVANILINSIVVEPALAAAQIERFHRAILVYNSDETARRLPTGTPLDALGPARLKGLDRPIEVHSIRV